MRDATGEAAAVARRAFLAVLLAYAGGYVLFFFVGVFTFPQKFYLPTYRGAWTALFALRSLLDTLLTVHCTVILVAYAFAPPRGLSRTEGITRVMPTTIAALLLLTFIFTVAQEAVHPLVLQRLNRMRHLTAVARDFLAKADRARRDGSLELRKSYLQFYLTIDPDNEDVERTVSDLRADLAAVRRESAASGQPSRVPPLSERTPGELVAQATAYFARGDYFTSYYYASLAEEISGERGERRADAARIAAESWARLSAVRLSEDQRELAALHREKRAGLEALSSSDPDRRIQGYYIFRKLTRSHPDDPEAAKYYQQSLEALTGLSFLLTDAEETASMPGRTNIVFLNSDPESPYREIVHIGKIVETARGAFVHGVEMIRFRTDSEPVVHLRAQLGQLLGHTIVMRGMDPDDPERRTQADYLVRTAPVDTPDLLEIRPSLRELRSLSRPDAGEPIAGGFLELREASAVLSRYGFRREPTDIEGLLRLVQPFSFFILSIVSVAIGWSMKPRMGYPPAFSLLFLPVFPFVVNGIVRFYTYGHRLLIGALVLSSGFPASLAALLGLESVLLVLAIFFLAGRIVDASP